MEEIREIKLSGKHGGIAKVSAVDFERVSEHRWKIFGGYARARNIGSMHKFVIGERPNDIPLEWVIDHKDRDKFNNCQSNLRWVCQSFNNWNVPIEGKSKYKNVTWEKKKNKWCSSLKKKHLGYFDDEKKAGWASAIAAIREWGLIAAESDLLVGPELFTEEDIKKMQDEISKEIVVVKPIRELPKGVCLVGKRYSASYGKKRLGYFATILEAETVYNTYVLNLKEKAWQDHLLLEIVRDNDGHAVIELSGKNGKDKFTKVPEQFWHTLTFQKSWCFSGEYAGGKWTGTYTTLHSVIYKMLYPEYVYTGDNSIDHINCNTLDNRVENLRTATRSEQEQNKNKILNTTSKYRGIHFDKHNKMWIGQLRLGDAYYKVSAKTENEAAEKLNEKRLEILGDKAILITIIE